MGWPYARRLLPLPYQRAGGCPRHAHSGYHVGSNEVSDLDPVQAVLLSVVADPQHRRVGTQT